MATTFLPLAPQRMSSDQLQHWLAAQGNTEDALGASITATLSLLEFDRAFYELPEELQPYLSRFEQHLKGALQALAEAQAMVKA